MESKRIAVLTLFLMLIVAGFLFYFLAYTKEEITGKVVGTSRDSHGCLIHQGFTWNESEMACVREWLSSNQSRYQVNNFSSCRDSGYIVSRINTNVSDFFNATNETVAQYSNSTNFTGNYCKTPGGKIYLEEVKPFPLNETNSTASINDTNLTVANETSNITKNYTSGTTENIINGQIYYTIPNA
jgi:hypothetical protein